MKKRAPAVILLSLALTAVAFGGFINAYAMFRIPNFAFPGFSAITFCYSIAALTAAAGIWWQRAWAFIAYVVWAAIVLGGMTMFQVQIAQLPWFKFAIGLVVFVAILWGLGRYVRRYLKPAL